MKLWSVPCNFKSFVLLFCSIFDDCLVVLLFIEASWLWLPLHFPLSIILFMAGCVLTSNHSLRSWSYISLFQIPTVLDKQGAQLLAVALLVVSRTWISDRIASLNGIFSSLNKHMSIWEITWFCGSFIYLFIFEKKTNLIAEKLYSLKESMTYYKENKVVIQMH